MRDHCYTSQDKVEVMQHIAELLIDCSFLCEEQYQFIKVLSVRDALNIDGGLLADIVIHLPELRILNLRNSGVSQYNVLTMSRNSKQLLVLDANCDHFLYSTAYCVVANLKTLRKFECTMYLPKEESKDWAKLVSIFGIRVEFGAMMLNRIRFWERRRMAALQFESKLAIEQ